jgi:basic membrane protein A
MKKKTSALWAFLILAAILISGCGSSDPDCLSPEKFCVGVVTSVGKIDDKALNELTWEGVKQAERDLGAYVQYIESANSRDYEKNIATFANANYDVIITVGYGQKQVTQNAASKYSSIDFIGVDQPQDPDKFLPKNLTGLNFPEDQAGFLAGALAAQMTETGKIGAVCGPDWFEPATLYGEGFKAGAAYIDPAVEVTVVYHTDGGFNASPFDPEWDAVTANTIIDGGADVIFGAGGDEKNGAVTAAAERKVYAIGVNTDQYLTIREAREVLLSSAIKLVAPGVFSLIEAAKNGEFPGGSFMGQVGYAPFHDLDSKVPNKVKASMKEIQIGLIDGSISVDVLQPTPEPTPESTLEPTT